MIFLPVLSLLAQFLRVPLTPSPTKSPDPMSYGDFACQGLLDLGPWRFGLHHGSLRDLPLGKAQHKGRLEEKRGTYTGKSVTIENLNPGTFSFFSRFLVDSVGMSSFTYLSLL